MEEEEAKGREIWVHPLLDEVLFPGLCPLVAGLPADPPLLLLSSHPGPVGSPQSSAHRRDRETGARRNRSCLSAPPCSSSSLLHHPPFPPNLRIPPELEPGRGFSGEPEHERARATHRLLWSSPEIQYQWRVVSHSDAWQGRPDAGTQNWDECPAAWKCPC